MPRKVSIAACQFVVRPVGSFDEFATHARGLLDRAEGADLVLFPELFTIELFTTFPDWMNLPVSELTRIHEYGNTNYTEDYRQLFESEARERGQYIVAGSHLEKKDGRYLNVAYLYGPDGLVHTHDKTHIFPAEAQWSTEEGDTIEMVELPFAKVGFNVCYETEIPECAASLVEQGAEIILCPSLTFTEYGFWRVRHCAQARAIENQVYVLATALKCAYSLKSAGRCPLDVELGTWGRDASSRSAAPTLRFGPSGDAPQPQVQWAFHGQKGASGHGGRTREIKRLSVVKYHI